MTRQARFALTILFFVASCSSATSAPPAPGLAIGLARQPKVAHSAPLKRAEGDRKPNFTANVMAPLWLSSEDDWENLGKQLEAVRSYGVKAVSVDVWWGIAEPTDNVFQWAYYERLFKVVSAVGLKVVPIFSFHECKGNVGDKCDIPIPPWLWTKYLNQSKGGITIRGADDLKYRSEQGHFSTETIQVWADNFVMNEYEDFAVAFAQRFAKDYSSSIVEINVSLGPAGELRYPSYNYHDSGSGYPTRGSLQAHSTLAFADFRNAMHEKYGTLAALNASWRMNLQSWGEVTPPQDRDQFFVGGAYRTTTYGKDFVDWYNQSLVTHGRRVLESIDAALGDAFPNASLGYKIPGVHWAMAHPQYPRAAEVAAGLVQTSNAMDSDENGHGYQKIVSLAKQVQTRSRSVVLHFTCLEMDDAPAPEAYSLAKSLVFWVAALAQKQGIVIKGENALAGNLASDHGWDNLINALDWASYSGLTILRLGDVSSGLGARRYQQLIARYQ